MTTEMNARDKMVNFIPILLVLYFVCLLFLYLVLL